MKNRQNPSYDLTKNEIQASSHINIVSHYDDETLIDRNNCLIKIIKVNGIDSVTKDAQELDNYKNRRNTLLKSFSSEFAFYFWEIRSPLNSYPEGDFASDYANSLNERYKNKIAKEKMFHTEHFVAIISKESAGVANQLVNFFRALSHRIVAAEREKKLARRHQVLNDAAMKIISGLNDYDCKILNVCIRNNIKHSLPIEFCARLLNGEKYTIPLTVGNSAELMARKQVFFNARQGIIELRDNPGEKRFGAVLAIKGYQPVTQQGLLNGLSKLDIEYIISQSYRPIDNHTAKSKMRELQSDMEQSKDESISQTDEIDDAFDNAAMGSVGYGTHHFSLVCFANCKEELNKYIGIVSAYFSDIDIACIRETVATECSYWAQLPGNFSYIVRPALISSQNMAAFASLNNIPIGKMINNHWGSAVTILETIVKSPYYFNFHYKDVGNFLVFGAMGSGKTVLIGFLIAQSMKFGGKRVIFDKDRGLEILIRAMGGTYETLKPGVGTGFNPCQLADTPANRYFLVTLLGKMLVANGENLSATDKEVISLAVAGLYRLEPNLRQMRHLAPFFGMRASGSLRQRFDQWHSDGVYAWLFDHPIDSLNLNARVLGFGLDYILKDEYTKTPALMYLTYRVEAVLEGNPGVLFIDEGWNALNDGYFKELIDNWSRTPRKLDNIFGLATQVANDAANSLINKSLNESAFCKFFFPNPSADRKVYIDEFGLTEHEYNLIKTMPDDQHHFLLSHGRGAKRQSVIARLNLEGMEDDIAIISGRESSLAVFDDVRREFGDDPGKWIPIFIEHIKRGNACHSEK